MTIFVHAIVWKLVYTILKVTPWDDNLKACADYDAAIDRCSEKSWIFFAKLSHGIFVADCDWSERPYR